MVLVWGTAISIARLLERALSRLAAQVGGRTAHWVMELVRERGVG